MRPTARRSTISEPTMTVAYALWTLTVHGVAWGFCLYVGWRLGWGVGAAAFLLMELRAFKSVQSVTRRFRREGRL